MKVHPLSRPRASVTLGDLFCLMTALVGMVLCIKWGFDWGTEHFGSIWGSLIAAVGGLLGLFGGFIGGLLLRVPFWYLEKWSLGNWEFECSECGASSREMEYVNTEEALGRKLEKHSPVAKRCECGAQYVWHGEGAQMLRITPERKLKLYLRRRSWNRGWEPDVGT